MGHIGTNFDAINKEFPLENIKRVGRTIDISDIIQISTGKKALSYQIILWIF